LVIGLAPATSKKMRKSRVKSDLHQIETAIENYKAKFGVYPPDNQTVVPNSQSHYPFPNQLLYELTGCAYQKPAGPFECVFNNTTLSTSDLTKVLNTDGIQNSSDDRKEVRSFFKELKATQVGKYTTTGVDIYMLKVPFPGPDGATNYWKYVSKNPTNNTQTFDLWAEIVVGGTTNLIGNWSGAE